jgi:microcystin-dependent protein
MATNNFVGEIRPVGFNFAPVGWALCNGQLLSINSYEALFALIGTTYGGDGQSTFGLPNLQSRVPLHVGTGPSGTYVLGQLAGTESVTLNISQLPKHNHTIAAQGATGTAQSPRSAVFAKSTANQYGTASSSNLTAPLLTPNGGSQPHENIQPYLCVNYIIALYGIYPSSN